MCQPLSESPTAGRCWMTSGTRCRDTAPGASPHRICRAQYKSPPSQRGVHCLGTCTRHAGKSFHASRQRASNLRRARRSRQSADNGLSADMAPSGAGRIVGSRKLYRNGVLGSSKRTSGASGVAHLRAGRLTSKWIVSACVVSNTSSGCRPFGRGRGTLSCYDGCVVVAPTSHRQPGHCFDTTALEMENKVA